MALLPAPTRGPGPEQGALRPAWPVRGTKGARSWACPAPRPSFPSRPAWHGLSPFSAKMPDIPELCWPVRWHRELFFGEKGVRRAYLCCSRRVPSQVSKGRNVDTTRIVRGPAHQQAAAQKPGVWHTGLAFFPAPGRERNVSTARLLAHAPTPAIPRGAV